jgi:hypothetical protein
MSAARAYAVAAGLAVAVLGLALLLFEQGALDIEGGWLAAIVTALAGGALVASGLGAREP